MSGEGSEDMTENDRRAKDICAANTFRTTLLDRADGHRGVHPVWHGWAIADAYLAGLDVGRAERTERLEADVKRLQAIVDQYPKTEDGVPIVPNMTTSCDDARPFSHFSHSWDMRLASGETYAKHCRRCDEKHYSTREAAADAAKLRGKKG